MNYRKLAGTDLEVSRLALGCFAFAGGTTWGDQDDADTVSSIKAALDAGINFFDTAEGYGDGYSESMLAKVIKDVRQDIIIATKVSKANLRAADVISACERSLKHLETDYIDLYQIHWPNHEVPITETITALETLQERGMVRHIAVSNFGHHDLRDYLSHAKPVSNQLPYNLLWRAIEFEILPQCQEHQVDVLPYSPLMQGLLTAKFSSPDDVPPGRARTRHYATSRPQANHGEPGAEKETFATVARLKRFADDIGQPLSHLALAWLLAQPRVPSVLVGARNAAQVKDNVKAARLNLTEDTVYALSELTKSLKTGFGANPDMWNGEENSRYR